MTSTRPGKMLRIENGVAIYGPRPAFTPGETVEILYFTDDLSSWERTWQPATYVSLYGMLGASAHIVSCPVGDKIVAFDEIRKVAR